MADGSEVKPTIRESFEPAVVPRVLEILTAGSIPRAVYTGRRSPRSRLGSRPRRCSS